MAEKPKTFEIIDGDATPRRTQFAEINGDKLTLMDCPVCKREDEIEWSQFAVIIRGVLTDGRKVSLNYSSETELVCTRCLKLERAGMRFKPGLVAVWDDKEGWVRLDKI